MSDLYQRLQNLSVQQRAVLAAQLQQQTAAPVNTRLVAFVVPTAGNDVDIDRVRKALAERLPEYMVPSFILPLEKLPLTPNGKIDHKALAMMEVSGGGSQADYAEPRSETEQLLAGIWSDVLSLDMIGVHDDFFEVGGDSILSIQIVARARQAGMEITPAMLFKYPTIAELAAVVETNQPQQSNAQQGVVTGAVPLIPIQHWFFDNGLQRPAHWNQALLLRVTPSVSTLDLRDALWAILQQHDALRTRFINHDGVWTQEQVEMPAALTLESFDLRGKPAAEQTAFIEQIANENHQGLRLEQADLFRLTHFLLSDSQDALLFISHHLVVDGISWRLILEDVHTALEQRGQNRPIALPPKSTAFQAWSQRLQTYPDMPNASAAQAYWLSERFRQPQPLPRDLVADDSLNTVDSGRLITQVLSAAYTQALLEDVPGVYHTQINDVLLTALVQTLAEWLGEDSVLFAMEGHGRETLFDDIDVTRTVGWFTSVFPVRLDLIPGDLGQTLLSIKEQLRALPDNGMSYGLLKYSQTYQEPFSSLAEPDILFNYLGRNDSLLAGLDRFELVTDTVGETRYPKDRHRYLIEVNSFIRDGCFHSRWSYSSHLHSEYIITRLSTRFHQALQAIIDYCRSPQAGGHSLSDFPLAELDQESFDQIADLLDTLDD
jgi:non-ribosomal peptide synthase protein (TIGR01720 family)